MKKRLLALLLAVVMVAAMIPASVFAEDELQTDGYNWSRWEYEYEYYTTKDKVKVRAIKAKKHDDVQYLYAVVNGDLVYDGTAVEFVGDKTTDLSKYVTFKVDTYDDDEFKSSKTLIKGHTYGDSKFTNDYAEFDDGDAWENIIAWFKDDKKVDVDEAKNAGEYTARFTLKDVDIDTPCKYYPYEFENAKTEFTIKQKNINAQSVVVTAYTDFWFDGKAFDIKNMEIDVNDTFIKVSLVEEKDYAKVVLPEDYDPNKEYTEEDPLVITLTGINNYCDNRTIEVTIIKPVVSFESNGGSAVPEQRVVFGEKAVKPEDPKKEGYKFAGWYTTEELEEAYDFDTPVEDNTILYAKWVANVNTGVTTNSNMTLIIAGGMILLAAALVAIVLKKRASQK